MKHTKILESWGNNYGRKYALALTDIGYTPLSKGCTNHYILTLFDINDSSNEVNELSREELNLDATQTDDDIWLEAMLSWGEFISSKRVVKCELDLDQHDLIEFCINNTLLKPTVTESNSFEVLTWSTKINSSSNISVAN
ncbi:hypothetical protein H5185_15485 [Shewanella sp. SG44-6]|jgi:hypothetical protein|uniref:hypothetical protein n=1 Tax=Shewanella sp. SG44-6 TaxID=2760959 RepID=UPI0016020164|nr:hypothetical protein [Shewanella sp. SG44-6]MBB1390807.1 hypothetical protein [Shewanella sp. SG44-6]